MSRVNILGNSSRENDTASVIKSYHESWRNTNKYADPGFFALYNAFRDKGYLKDLDTGPLRLYLYFGFSANNTYGYSWPSVETIAKYFDKQTRTIDYWIQELVKVGLIYRERDAKKSSTTYLIPYGDTVMRQRPSRMFDHDDQGMFDNLIKVVEGRKEVYGPITGVFHLFHWGYKKGNISPDFDKSNIIFIITKRNNGILIGHMYQLKKSSDYGISKLNIQDPVTFESPFMYLGQPVRGIAVRHSHRLKTNENYKTWIPLLRDLAQAKESVFSEYPSVEYGPVEDVLDLEKNDNSEDDDTDIDDEEDTE